MGHPTGGFTFHGNTGAPFPLFQLTRSFSNPLHLYLAAAEPDAGWDVGGEVADVRGDGLTVGLLEVHLDTAVGEASGADIPDGDVIYLYATAKQPLVLLGRRRANV